MEGDFDQQPALYVHVQLLGCLFVVLRIGALVISACAVGNARTIFMWNRFPKPTRNGNFIMDLNVIRGLIARREVVIYGGLINLRKTDAPRVTQQTDAG